MSNNNPQRSLNLSYCNFAKAVLMILIVLCHSASYYGGAWFTAAGPVMKQDTLAYLASWLGTFHVAGFTLISGYIYYAMKNEFGKYKEFGPFLRNKAFRLLVPYAAVSLLWVIPINNYFYHYSFSQIIYKFGLGVAPAQLWFLLMLFGVFVIAHIIFDKISTKIMIPAIISVYFIGSIVGGHFPYFQIFVSLKYLLFFYIGFLLRKYMAELMPEKMLKYGILFLFINFSFFALIYNFHATTILLKAGVLIIRMLTEISGALMAFMILGYLASRIKKHSTLINMLMELSFPIYLLHQQIIYLLIWNFKDIFDPIFMTIVNLIIALILSFGLSLLLRTSYFTSLLIGEKRSQALDKY